MIVRARLWILCISIYMNLLYVEHTMLSGILCLAHVVTKAGSGSEGLSHTEIEVKLQLGSHPTH